MPSVGVDTYMLPASSLMRHMPRRRTTNDGVAPAYVVRSDGRAAIALKVGDGVGTPANNSESWMQYSMAWMVDGSPSAPGHADSISNASEFRVAALVRFHSLAGLLDGSTHLQLLNCYSGGDNIHINVQFRGPTTARVFQTGGTPTSSTGTCADITTDADHVIELYYKSAGGVAGAGRVRLWVDGVEVTLASGMAEHSVTATVSTYAWMCRNVGTLSAGQSPEVHVLAHRVQFGASIDLNTRLDFSELEEGGTPPGLAHWSDVTHEEAILRVSEFPGRLGYAETWTRVLWAVGASGVWPGDGSASSTDAIEHTQAGHYLAHHRVDFGAVANPAHVLMAKVVVQDAEEDPANTWTSGVYEIKPLQAPGGATLTRPLVVWQLGCMKGYGRGLPEFLRIIAGSVNSAHDTIAMGIEDTVYRDDIEPNTNNTDALVYPLEQYAPPDFGSPMPSGLGLGVTDAQRMLWESPAFHALASRVAFVMASGDSDHLRHNSWTRAWSGDDTEVGGDFGSKTRDEIHVSAEDFCDTVIAPSLLGAPAQGSDPSPPIYSAKRVGPVLMIALAPYRYATPGGTWLGAAQLAWLRNLLQTTTAKTVCIEAPQSLFDAVYKAGQGAHAQTSWRNERTLWLDDIEGNANIESAAVFCSDAHAWWYYPSPSAAHPKVLAEVGVGALSSTMMVTITSADTIADIEAVVTAGGRDGWVGPHAGTPNGTTGGELGDGRHQRRTMRCVYGVDGSLTLEFFNANWNPASPPTTLPAPMQTVTLQAWTVAGALSAEVNETPVADEGTADLGEVEAGASETVSITLEATGGDVALGAISVTGDGAAGSSNPSNTTITSGSTTTLTVNLNTGSLGEKTVTVSIPSDAAGSPYVIELDFEVTGSVSLDEILSAAQEARAAAVAAQTAAEAATTAASTAATAVAALNTRLGALLEPAPSGTGVNERFRSGALSLAPTGGFDAGPGAVDHPLTVLDGNGAPVAGARVWITSTPSSSDAVVVSNLFTDGNGVVRVNDGTPGGAPLLLLPGDYYRHCIKPGANLINPQPFTVLSEEDL